MSNYPGIELPLKRTGGSVLVATEGFAQKPRGAGGPRPRLGSPASPARLLSRTGSRPEPLSNASCPP